MTAATSPEPGTTASDAQLDPETLRRRWNLVLPHREQLLRTARRRLGNREDAEDVVGTALVRTVEHRSLDESRVGAFLCTTVLRLVADVHRDRTRQLAIGIRDATHTLPATPAEEALCDDAEARWLSEQLGECPERERQVLAARVAGLSPQECETHLGMTAKAVENAFTRVRHRGQRLVAATLGLAPVLARFTRRAPRPAFVAVPVAAVTALGLAIVAPPSPGVRPPASVPGVEAAAGAARANDRIGDPAPQPRPSVTNVALVAAAPASALAPGSAQPTAERTELRVPAVVDRRTVDPGGVTIERRHQNETFMESVWRCVNHVDPRDPAADPCR